MARQHAILVVHAMIDITTLPKRYPELVKAAREGDLCPFIGAGFARTAGLPLWRELMQPIAERLGVSPETNPIQVAEFYVHAHAQGRHLLNTYLSEALAVERARPSAAYEYLKALPAKYILTTNFDRILETTFEKLPSRPFDLVIVDADISYLRGSGKTPIIKLNGCISRRDTIVITRGDFEQYRSKRPQMADLVRTILASTTLLYLGTSFSDPVFPAFNAEVLGHLGGERKPAYMLMLRTSPYEIEDFRRRGIEVIDLELPADASEQATSDEVAKFMRALLLAVQGDAQPPAQGSATSGATIVTGTPSNPLANRLGTSLSIQVNPAHVDATHEYDLVFRQDLLDYRTGDFYSFRRLKGRNASQQLSAFLLYSESSEQKITFSQTCTRAYDTKSWQSLVVEPDVSMDVLAFTHAFRIFFPTPLAPGEEFDITYDIRLPGELRVLSQQQEIMSISLARIQRKVKQVEFNVCLNFHPRAVSGECLNAAGAPEACGESQPFVGAYDPQSDLEKFFRIDWSSPPCKISWNILNPMSTLYIVNYRS